MDKRSILALFLILVVIVAGTLIQQRLYPPVADSLVVDSASRAVAAPGKATPATRPDSVVKTPTMSAATAAAAAPAPLAAAPETAQVDTKGRQLRFVGAGASLASVTLTDYRDLKHRNGPL